MIRFQIEIDKKNPNFEKTLNSFNEVIKRIVKRKNRYLDKFWLKSKLMGGSVIADTDLQLTKISLRSVKVQKNTSRKYF